MAPARAASWTARLPTPPVAPTTSSTSPSERSSASTAVMAVMPASGAAPAIARSTPVGHGRDRELLGDGDQLGPGAVAHGRVGVQQEPEDLVAGLVAADGGAGLLDHAGVVAAEDDGVLVLDAHLGEQPGGDRVVDRVDRGGVHAHEHLVVGRGRRGEVLAQGGVGFGAVEGDGAHGGLLRFGRDRARYI